MLGIIRIDKLLNISFTISCLLGVIYGIACLSTGSEDLVVYWNVGNLVICGAMAAFMLFQEIESFLYDGHFSLL